MDFLLDVHVDVDVISSSSYLTVVSCVISYSILFTPLGKVLRFFIPSVLFFLYCNCNW